VAWVGFSNSRSHSIIIRKKTLGGLLCTVHDRYCRTSRVPQRYRQTDGRATAYSQQCSLIKQYRSLTVSRTCIAINKLTRESVNNIDALHSKWCSAIMQWSKKLCILACKRDPIVRDRDIWFSVRDEIETETFPRFHETETFGNYVSRPRRRDRDYIPASQYFSLCGMTLAFWWQN